MTSPKIVSVTPLERKRLRVEFSNGATRIYDCNPLLKMERFQLLRTDAFFRSVRVDVGGYGISWNDEIDLSEDELWHNGILEHFPSAAQPAQ